MYRTNNNNINDLISRFDVTNADDFDLAENAKYAARHNARKYKEETFGTDENRSLMKYSSDRVFDHAETLFVRQTPLTTTTTTSGAKEFIKQMLQKISALLEMISKFPFPRMSVMSFGLTSLLVVFLAPRAFTDRVLYPGFKILFTIIYPAYRSFKAVRNKNLKEYLKWIVYWIVFSFFTCTELVTDALLSWFPFYNEIKVAFLIWVLGPSSKGAMKVYKGIIHPMLISREREIDDVIQLAQDFGFMQVFRLSSKSVNYANKIIMQDTKAEATAFMMSPNQLMKNISLSNVSDAGLMQSPEDADELLRMRRFSLDKAPFEQRRKPSFDYRYDDMSSGYASPIIQTPLYRTPRGAFIEETVGDLSRTNSRKASLTELSDDAIIVAYHKLLKQQQQQQQQLQSQQQAAPEVDDESYREFQRWLEARRRAEDEKKSIPSPPAAANGNGREEQVITGDAYEDAINVEADATGESVSVAPAEDVHSTEPEDEFKDAIDDDYLSVPLVICEDDTTDIVPTVVEERSESTDEPAVVSAALTLSNEPLQVTASLSTSSVSLVSNDENGNKKRPARHGKGRAPPPPPPASPSTATAASTQPSTSNVIAGYYYDELTDRHFKETEL